MVNSSHTIIEGNSIDYGSGTLDQITSTQYSYERCLALSADAIVSNNYFAGISANKSLISITNGSSNFNNNKFVRAASIVPSYIASTSSEDQVITKNFFDSTTVDGSLNETLVSGITASSTYVENKNQTAYAVVSKTNHLTYSSSMVSPTPIPTVGDEGEVVSYQFVGNLAPTVTEKLNISYDSASTASYVDILIIADFQLNDYLPENVKILNLLIGLQLSVTGNYTSGSYSLSCRTSVSGAFNPASLTGSLADVATLSSNGLNNDRLSASFSVPSGISIPTFAASTRYLSIDIAASAYQNNYIAGKNNKIAASYVSSTRVTSPAGFTTNILESPLLIKYRW